MIPADVKSLMTALEQRGHTVYAVGGCVRDSLLGRPPGDWDLASSANTDAVLNLPFECAVKSAKFGVVTVQTGLRSVEVAAFRKESGYSDHRRPDRVSFDCDLLTDLTRRDFTVNALALSLDGTITDPFGGQDDIKARLIRCIGDPFDRFNQDALRILRALRFCFALGFELEDQTKEAMLTHMSDLNFLTKTVILGELRKFL